MKPRIFTAALLHRRAENLAMDHALKRGDRLGLLTLLLGAATDMETAAATVAERQGELLSWLHRLPLYTVLQRLLGEERLQDMTDGRLYMDAERLTVDGLMHAARHAMIESQSDYARLAMMTLLLRCSGFHLADAAEKVALGAQQIDTWLDDGVPLYVAALRLTGPPDMTIVWTDEPHD